MIEPDCPFCGAKFSHYTPNGSGTRIWECASEEGWDNRVMMLKPEQSITCRIRALEAEIERLKKQSETSEI